MKLKFIFKITVCIFVCCLQMKIGFSQSPFDETIDNIRAEQYTLAQEQIEGLNDKNLISQIIEDTYQNKTDSFWEILNFAKAITRPELSFLVLKALYNAIVRNKHFDPLTLVPLGKAFHKTAMLLPYSNENGTIMQTEAKRSVNEIKLYVIISAANILARALLLGKFINNQYVEDVAEEVFKFNYYDVHEEIIRQIIERTHPHIPASEIIETFMVSSKFISQQASLILAVSKVLEKNKDLDNLALFTIASSIERLKSEENYDNLFPKQKYEINLLIDKIPTCARNLFFANEVCIWNAGKGEYLYRDSSQKYGAQEIVYTFTNEGGVLKEGEAAWFAESFFGNFQFRNQLFKKEYLTLSTKTFKGASYVQTSYDEKNNLLDETSVWKVELKGDYCLIRNANNEEYLFSSYMVSGSERKAYAMTASAFYTRNFTLENFLWQIRDCT